MRESRPSGVSPARVDDVRLPDPRAPGAQAAEQEPPAEARDRDVLDALDVALHEQVLGGPLAVREGPARGGRGLEGAPAGLVGGRGEQGQADDGDQGRVDARGGRDGLDELVADEVELGLRERQGDVDAHGLGVRALVAHVAEAAELGHAALGGAGVGRALLEVARGLAEGVGRAGRAVREVLEAQGGRVGAERALGVVPAARAVERGRERVARRRGLLRERARSAQDASALSW